MPDVLSIWSTLIYGTPFLRAQALLQTQDVNPALRFKPAKGLFNCLGRITREEGPVFLWRSGILCFLTAACRHVFEAACNEYEIEISFTTEDSESTTTTDQLAQKKEEESTVSDSNDTNKTSANSIESFTSNSETIDKEVLKENIITEVAKEDNPFSKPGIPLSAFIIGWNVLTHPLEVLRVRLACDFGDKGARKYSGILSTAKSLNKAEGAKAFFRGFLPMTLALLLEKNIHSIFTSQEKLEEYGPLAWLVMDIVGYPLRVISHKLMMQPDNPFIRFDGMMDCFRRTYQTLGFRGLYRGYSVNVLFWSVVGIAVVAEAVANAEEMENENGGEGESS